jgi:hypothetical protein
MRKDIIQALLAVATGGLLATGCVYSHREAAVREPTTTTTTTVVHEPATVYPTPTGRTEHVIVYDTPPPPRHETLRSPRDQDNQSWISGYWTFTDNRWVWVPGHLEAKPTPTATWVQGHWDHNPDGAGWVWTPGHWE